jgi:hypothetical protein
MASAAASAGLASKEKSSESSETLSKLEEQIEIIGKRIEYNQLKIEEKKDTMKGIVRECAGDETKKKKRMPELEKHFEEKKQLLSQIETDRGQQSNLKVMHFNLLTQLWNETKTPELAAKLRNVLEERKAEKDKSASANGGKRRKPTTRKQKGRRATKKQNKNKKSRKQ